MTAARLIAAVALLGALGGCDELRRLTGQEAPAGNVAINASGNSSAVAPSLSAPASGVPAKPVRSDPALEALVQQEVATTQASLPITIDPITQVVGLRADGTEFVYDVRISRPVPDDRVEELRSSFQAQSAARLCGTQQTGDFIRRGGSMNHRYSDPSGFRFETRVVSCP